MVQFVIDFEIDRAHYTGKDKLSQGSFGFQDGELCWGCNITDQSAYKHSRLAPGRTSCMFLEMALKRLYARDDFDVLESLGEGFFGDVYKVRS